MSKKYKTLFVNDIYLNLSHALDHFMMLIFAKAAYDASKYFSVSYDSFIIYGTLGFILFGAMAPVAAYLADRYSRSLLMVIFHFGIGVSAILAGLSSTVYQLAISMGLIGVFASIYHPVGISMLLKSNRNIGFRLGINGVFGNMGIAMAPLVTGALLTFGNWKICFLFPGVICILYGILFLKALKPSKDINLSKNLIKNLGKFAPDWPLVFVALIISSCSGGFIFGSMTFFIPRYFEISMTNISNSVFITGFLASLVYAIASFSQIGVGWLIDRLSPKKILFCMGIGQCFFIWLTSILTDYSLFFIMIMAMCFVFGQIPITDTIISRYVPDLWRAKILSLKFLLNLSVGALILPIGSKLLQNGFLMSELFFIISLISFFIIISAIILPNQSKTERIDLKS